MDELLINKNLNWKKWKTQNNGGWNLKAKFYTFIFHEHLWTEFLFGHTGLNIRCLCALSCFHFLYAALQSETEMDFLLTASSTYSACPGSAAGVPVTLKTNKSPFQNILEDSRESNKPHGKSLAGFEEGGRRTEINEFLWAGGHWLWGMG